jgi:hypothetical protein
MANPLDDLLVGLSVLREQVRQSVGGEVDWLERLDPRRQPPDSRSLPRRRLWWRAS